MPLAARTLIRRPPEGFSSNFKPDELRRKMDRQSVFAPAYEALNGHRPIVFIHSAPPDCSGKSKLLNL